MGQLGYYSNPICLLVHWDSKNPIGHVQYWQYWICVMYICMYYSMYVRTCVLVISTDLIHNCACVRVYIVWS